VPLREEKIKRILSLPRDWGVITCEEDIDKCLYDEGLNRHRGVRRI
jgi:hypothetical protein